VRILRKIQDITLLVLLAMRVLRADFYVAPGGVDRNDGTEAKPFSTLERARDAVRELKQGGKLPKHGVTVWLRKGDYVRTNAFELTAVDSGTAEGPICWRAFGDEHARMLGGRVLSGFVVITNADVLSRFDEKARGHVLQLNLRERGIENFGEMKSRGFGRGAVSHYELFFDGRPMTLARWPNGEWEKIAGFPETSGTGDDHGGKIGDLKGGFFYEGDRPRRWKDTSDLWVHGYWAWDWANSYERVAELDTARHFIRTAAPYGQYGFRKGQRFLFLNVLEELDQAGEWFLDRKLGKLYFWPPEKEKANQSSKTEGLLSLLDQPLVKITGGSNIVLRGLVLEATRANAVEIHRGASNLVVGCLIRNVGNTGVTIEGGQGNGVRSCDVFDTGDGGVSLSGGDRQTLWPGGHFVENCHFQRQGRWSKCYVPAILMSGVGQRASHNVIHDHPHAAMLFNGNDHLIEFNEIHHIALETGDVGAIYAGRDYSFRGNRIRHNYIHETGGMGMGSMGVYMDDCVSGAEVLGNVFYKVHWAMFIGGGRDHRVENNLFVDCEPAVRVDGRGLDTSPVWRGMVDDYMRKQLAAVPLKLYRERYPAMKSLDAYYGPPEGPAIVNEQFKGVPPSNNVIVRNVALGKWFEAGWHASATDDTYGLKDNFVTTDPNQVGLVGEHFKLPKDSPAWNLGFKPIPFKEIGLKADEDRQRIQRIDGMSALR
jgi:hypothetical protein